MFAARDVIQSPSSSVTTPGIGDAVADIVGMMVTVYVGRTVLVGRGVLVKDAGTRVRVGVGTIVVAELVGLTVFVAAGALALLGIAAVVLEGDDL